LPHAVGVAYVLDFVGRMEALPRFVTLGRSGEGFAELVAQLVAARGASTAAPWSASTACGPAAVPTRVRTCCWIDRSVGRADGQRVS
jgi:hypothetical protein